MKLGKDEHTLSTIYAHAQSQTPFFCSSFSHLHPHPHPHYLPEGICASDFLNFTSQVIH